MEIVIKFRESDARITQLFLRKYYKSKANLNKLAKMAILEIAAKQANIDLKESKND